MEKVLFRVDEESKYGVGFVSQSGRIESALVTRPYPELSPTIECAAGANRPDHVLDPPLDSAAGRLAPTFGLNAWSREHDDEDEDNEGDLDRFFAQL